MNQEPGSAYFLAMENSSDAMIITDPEGLVIYANKAVFDTTGFTTDEAIGKKAGTLWGKLMDVSYYEKLWKTIKEDKQTFRGEFKNRRKGGEIYFAAVNISPVLNNKGEIIYFVAVERDITKAKEIDRMKTEFISLATHQLRTPLSTMRWQLEMLLSGDMGELSTQQKDSLALTQRVNLQMIELVNSLLDVSRIESGRLVMEPESIDLSELGKEVLTDLKGKIDEKQIHSELEFSDPLPKVFADPKLIRQVYLNLLTNAIKYSPDSGKIKILIFQKGDEIVSEIKDNGMGIPEDDKGRIFERFYRGSNAVKAVADGTGLGLYLVKEIVEVSGGKIWFESKEGNGSSFYFSLPITKPVV